MNIAAQSSLDQRVLGYNIIRSYMAHIGKAYSYTWNILAMLLDKKLTLLYLININQRQALISVVIFSGPSVSICCWRCDWWKFSAGQSQRQQASVPVIILSWCKIFWIRKKRIAIQWLNVFVSLIRMCCTVVRALEFYPTRCLPRPVHSSPRDVTNIESQYTYSYTYSF